MTIMTVDILTAVCQNSKNAALYADFLAQYCEEYKINSQIEQEILLAEIMNESSGLSAVVEDTYYTTAEYIHDVFPSTFPTVASAVPYVKNAAGLANKVYGNMQGRGLGMLTGLANYMAAAREFNMTLPQVTTYLTTPEGAARSAVWYYHFRGCDICAAEGDLLGVTRLWEGPTAIGYKDVANWHSKIAQATASLTALPSPVAAKPAIVPRPVVVKAPAPAPKPAPAPTENPTTDELNQQSLEGEFS